MYFPGYVNLQELLQIPLLQHESLSDVLRLLITSTSFRGVHRYEKKLENDVMYVRASYGRRMERV